MLLFMLVCEKMASPYLDRAKDTRKRLDSCWDLDLAWDKYPEVLNKVINMHGFLLTISAELEQWLS